MNFTDKDVVVVDCVRSPMGRSKKGGFVNVRAEDLSARRWLEPFFGGWGKDQFPLFSEYHQLFPGSDHRTKSQPGGTHQASLPSQENGRLIEHGAIGDISQQRGGGLVLVGCKIEMAIGASHFTVVFTPCPAGHHDITKID